MSHKPTAKIKRTYVKPVLENGETSDEKVEKINDYTIAVTTEGTMAGTKTSLKRIFNFEHGEVAEIFVSHSDKGLSSNVTKTTFNQLSAYYEVARMRDMLEAMGGTPPSLGAVLPERFLSREPRTVVHGFQATQKKKQRKKSTPKK